MASAKEEEVTTMTEAAAKAEAAKAEAVKAAEAAKAEATATRTALRAAEVEVAALREQVSSMRGEVARAEEEGAAAHAAKAAVEEELCVRSSKLQAVLMETEARAAASAQEAEALRTARDVALATSVDPVPAASGSSVAAGRDNLAMTADTAVALRHAVEISALRSGARCWRQGGGGASEVAAARAAVEEASLLTAEYKAANRDLRARLRRLDGGADPTLARELAEDDAQREDALAAASARAAEAEAEAERLRNQVAAAHGDADGAHEMTMRLRAAVTREEGRAKAAAVEAAAAIARTAELESALALRMADAEALESALEAARRAAEEARKRRGGSRGVTSAMCGAAGRLTVLQQRVTRLEKAADAATRRATGEGRGGATGVGLRRRSGKLTSELLELQQSDGRRRGGRLPHGSWRHRRRHWRRRAALTPRARSSRPHARRGAMRARGRRPPQQRWRHCVASATRRRARWHCCRRSRAGCRRRLRGERAAR